MRTIRLTALLLAVSVLDAAAQTTAIRFARVWDGERVVENAVVVVDSGRIVRVCLSAATTWARAEEDRPPQSWRGARSSARESHAASASGCSAAGPPEKSK